MTVVQSGNWLIATSCPPAGVGQRTRIGVERIVFPNFEGFGEIAYRTVAGPCPDAGDSIAIQLSVGSICHAHPGAVLIANSPRSASAMARNSTGATPYEHCGGRAPPCRIVIGWALTEIVAERESVPGLASTIARTSDGPAPDAGSNRTHVAEVATVH